MTDKVKLTQEQAAAIERYTEELYESLESQLKNENGLRSWAKCLVSLNAGKVMSAIIYGYEVEPEFEVGDWMINTSNDKAYELKEELCVKINANPGLYKHLRHATPEEIAEEKQRRWWAKHGRKIHEFKKNDVVSYQDNHWGGIYIVVINDYGKDAFGNQLVRVFSRNVQDGKTLSFDAKKLKVICFAEDRKDLEGQA